MRLLFATIIVAMTTLLCESSTRYFTSYDKSSMDFYGGARWWTYNASIRYMSVFSSMRVPRHVVRTRQALLTAIFLMFIFSLPPVARKVT